LVNSASCASDAEYEQTNKSATFRLGVTKTTKWPIGGCRLRFLERRLDLVTAIVLGAIKRPIRALKQRADLDPRHGGGHADAHCGANLIG
jgi:hypothetical protein